MPVCVIVLADRDPANQLSEKLSEASIPIISCQLIKPRSEKEAFKKITTEATERDLEQFSGPLKAIEIDAVKLLNPKLGQQRRQRNMALWLAPFGFVTGLTFAQMTGLTTFSDLGIGSLGESFTGGLLGLGAGLIGSYFASSSVGSKPDEDVQALRKLSERGLWLLLIETPLEIEIPWNVVRASDHIDIVRLINQ